MSFGRKQARSARADAEQSAAEARNLRASIEKKEAEERLKVQRKFIRGVKGRFNPFAIFSDPQNPNSLGSTNPQAKNNTEGSL